MNSDSSALFTLPAEILEEIFLYLPTESLKNLLFATGGAAAGAADRFSHFRQTCKLTFNNFRRYAELRGSHPATAKAVQRHLGHHLRYRGDGEKTQRVVDLYKEVLRENRYETGRISLEVDEGPQFVFDRSTNRFALLRSVDDNIVVDIYDDKLRPMKRVEIGSLIKRASFRLHGRWLLWIERDPVSIYGFGHLKIKQFFLSGKKKEEEEEKKVAISKYGKLNKRTGSTKILVSSRFVVTQDRTQFLVFKFPSLEFVLRREANAADAALDGDYLFVSNDDFLSVWDLVKAREKRRTEMTRKLVVGSRRLKFPYLFYIVGPSRGPNDWHCMVLDSDHQFPPFRTGLEMQSTLVSSDGESGRGGIEIDMPAIDRGSSWG